ncbi:ankyrin repeat ph and sec7 domain containing protein secg-related [Anaeramoeba flamelloides]|uniref:Ankyrin repeat ph and sec7 domain containing protein secg-related n=1 Tax=Anaeramoeba flamelloides TaxID=1746091 RepID=A0AAV7YCS3_9EUKA|nr:ankyrin repeat ph and sec7 domain containing protein secg-related [Anaeramoeba flamelloides]
MTCTNRPYILSYHFNKNFQKLCNLYDEGNFEQATKEIFFNYRSLLDPVNSNLFNLEKAFQFFIMTNKADKVIRIFDFFRKNGSHFFTPACVSLFRETFDNLLLYNPDYRLVSFFLEWKPFLVNRINKKKFSPLLLYLTFSELEDLSVVKVLVEKGANLMHNDETILHLLFSHVGQDYFDQRVVFDSIKLQKKSDPFQIINSCLSAEIVEYLFSQLKEKLDFDINFQNSKGNSILHNLCRCKQKVCPKILQFLLEKGADANLENFKGNTPLSVLLSKGINDNQELVKLLIQYGAKLNYLNNQGKSIFEQLIIFYLDRVIPFKNWQLAFENSPLYQQQGKTNEKEIEIENQNQNENENEIQKEEEGREKKIYNLIKKKYPNFLKNKYDKKPFSLFYPTYSNLEEIELIDLTQYSSGFLLFLLKNEIIGITELSQTLKLESIDIIYKCVTRDGANNPMTLELVEYFIQNGMDPNCGLNPNMHFHYLSHLHKCEGTLTVIGLILLNLGRTSYYYSSKDLDINAGIYLKIKELIKVILNHGGKILGNSEPTPINVLLNSNHLNYYVLKDLVTFLFQKMDPKELQKLFVDNYAAIYKAFPMMELLKLFNQYNIPLNTLIKNFDHVKPGILFLSNTDRAPVYDDYFQIYKYFLDYCKDDPNLVNSYINESLMFLIKRGYIYSYNNELLDALEYTFSKDGVNANFVNWDLQNPLHVLIKNKDDLSINPIILYKIFELLIKNGVDVNHQDRDGNTCLHHFVTKYKQNYHDLNIFKLLLRHYTNINLQNDEGETILHKVFSNTIYIRLKHVNVSNHRNIRNVYANIQTLLLHYLRAILHSRADINIKNNEGDTPIHLFGYLISKMKFSPEYFREIVSLLKKHGADFGIPNNLKLSPLLIIVTSTNLPDLRLLQTFQDLNIKLTNNAVVDEDNNNKPSSGNTIFHNSTLMDRIFSYYLSKLKVYYGSSGALQKKLKIEIDNSIHSMQYLSTNSFARFSKDPKFLKGYRYLLNLYDDDEISHQLNDFLIKSGVDCTRLNENGQNALHDYLTKKRISINIIKFYIQNGVKTYQIDKFGFLPLDYLLRSDNFRARLKKKKKKKILKIINELLKAGSLRYLTSKHFEESLEFVNFKNTKKKILKLLSVNYDTLYHDFKIFFKAGEFADYTIKNIKVHKKLVEPRLNKTISEIENIFENYQENEIKNVLNWVYNDLIPNDEKDLLIFKEILLLFGIEDYENMSLTRTMCSLLHDDNSKDYSIIVESRKLKVHKFVLQARCGLFKGMFLTTSDNNDSIKDYTKKSYDTLLLLMEYLYTGKVNMNKLTKKIKVELMDCIDYYQLNPKSDILKQIK